MDSSIKLSPSSAMVISEKRLSWPLLVDGLSMRDVAIEVRAQELTANKYGRRKSFAQARRAFA
jgi:hypothetical protein